MMTPMSRKRTLFVGLLIMAIFSVALQAGSDYEPIIFVCDEDAGLVYQSDAEGLEFTPIPLPAAGKPIAVAYDSHLDLVFWIDADNDALKTAFRNGSYQAILAAGYNWMDLAINTERQDIALINESRTVSVINYSNAFKEQIDLQDNAICISSHPNGNFYIVEDNGNTTIVIYGQDVVDTFSIPSLNPASITFDGEGTRLFILDTQKGTVESSGPYGKDLQILLTYQDDMPDDLGWYRGSPFWTDDYTLGIGVQVDRRGLSSVSASVQTFLNPGGTFVYHGKPREVLPEDDCAPIEFACNETLCIPNAWVCDGSADCDGGVDETVCIEEDEPGGVLFVTDVSVGAIFMATTNDLSFHQIPLPGLAGPVAISYDSVEKRIYWAQSQAISAAYVNGSEHTVVVDTDLQNPEGLFVDTLEQSLYWTDAGKLVIEFIHFNGSNRQILVSTGLQNPRGIIILPSNRMLYWTDWGDDPRIERSELTGQNREVIVNTSIGWPNGITHDKAGSRLYWCDAQLDLIESVRPDGSDRVRLLDANHGVLHPFDLIWYNGTIMWTDWSFNGLGVSEGSKYVWPKTYAVVNRFSQPSGLYTFEDEDPTSVYPTSVYPTSVYPTSINPTSGFPTSGYPTSVYPTSINPTSGFPTSVYPTSVYPTSGYPTSGYPTSVNPTDMDPRSCQGRCDGEYEPGQICGCTSWCEVDSTCCDDFISLCFDNRTIYLTAWNISRVITSPNYPINYPNNARVLWVVVAPELSFIKVEFTDFRLEYNFDYVFMYSGAMPVFGEAQQIGYFHGYKPSSSIVAYGSFLFVSFASDPLINSAGFSLMVTAVNGSDDFGTTIYLTASNQSSVITSPNYPDNYPNNTYFVWTVVAPHAFRIEVQFTAFHLQSPWDYVLMYSGSTPSFGHSLKIDRPFTGDDPSPTIYTHGPYLWIFFSSDSLVTDTGFSLTVTAVNESGTIGSCASSCCLFPEASCFAIDCWCRDACLSQGNCCWDYFSVCQNPVTVYPTMPTTSSTIMTTYPSMPTTSSIIDPCNMTNDCSGIRICVSNLTTLTYTCICPDEYTMDQSTGFCVEIDKCADPSLNDCDENALCYQSGTSYTCVCASGYTGEGTLCEVDSEPCSSIPCNHGDCVNGDDGNFECSCDEEYEGELCNIKKDPILAVTVTKSPESQTIPLAQRVELECDFENVVQFWWEKDGARIAETDNQNVFVILSARPVDIGYYSCYGEGKPNGGGNATTEEASIFIKGLSNIVTTGARFNISVDRPEDLYNPSSSTYRDTDNQLTNFLQNGLLNTDGLASTPFSVVIKGLSPGSVVADFNIYLEDNMTSPFVLQDLVTSSLQQLASSTGILDVSRMIALSTLICKPVSWASRFGPASFDEGVMASRLNSTGTVCPFNTTNAYQPVGIAECMGDRISVAQWQPRDNCGPFRDVTELLEEIQEVVITNETAKQVAEQVGVITENSDQITSSDITLVTDIISNIANEELGEAEVTTSVTSIVSNIARADPSELQTAEEDDDAISRIIKVFEEQLSMVEVVEDEPFNSAQENVVVQVRSVPAADLEQGLVMSVVGDSSSDLSKTNITVGPSDEQNIIAQVYIPSEISVQNRSSGNIRIIMHVFATPSLFISLELLKFHRENDDINRTANTPVVSLTVAGKEVKDLAQPVNITFTALESGYQNQTCTYWDESASDWSTRGCVLISRDVSLFPDGVGNETKRETYICACDHLTNFAILMDIHDSTSEAAYNVLSYIGCTISMICLIVTLATYLWNKKRRSRQAHQILICLCATLLGLYTTFILMLALDTNRNRQEVASGACGFLASLVHYFALSSITWMGVEGYNNYLLVVRLFNSYVENFMMKAGIVAWGIPALIVLLTGAIANTNYAADDICFLQLWPRIGGLLIPMAVILVANVVIFILVVRRLVLSTKVAGKGKMDKKDERRATIERIQNAIAILVLLGLTWIAGYLLLIEALSQVAQALFIVFNSFQGLFIFLLYCVRNPSIRKQWGLTCSLCAGGRDERSRSSSNTVRSTSSSSEPRKRWPTRLFTMVSQSYNVHKMTKVGLGNTETAEVSQSLGIVNSAMDSSDVYNQHEDKNMENTSPL